MPNLPEFLNGFPLFAGDESGIPAMSTDCCCFDPCFCWYGDYAAGWRGCDLPWVRVSIERLLEPNYAEDGYAAKCRFRATVTFSPPDGITVDHWSWSLPGSDYFDANETSTEFETPYYAIDSTITVHVWYLTPEFCDGD